MPGFQFHFSGFLHHSVVAKLATSSIRDKSKRILWRGPVAISLQQGLSQVLETGCPKLAFVIVLGVQIFKGDHNILRFQP